MIDIIETFCSDGSVIASVRGLPAGSYCKVTVTPDGIVTKKTCNGSKPGIRYVRHSCYAAAIDAALDWAERKGAK